MRRNLLLALACAALAGSACGTNSDATDGPGTPNGSSSGALPTPDADADAGAVDGGDVADGGSDAHADVGPPPPPPPKVDVSNETLTVLGEPRTYTLVVPKSYAATKSYPLVLVFHGDGGSGPQIRSGYKFDDVTVDDAIVAYPTGQNSKWDLYTPEATNKDSAFLTSLVDHLKGRFNIDGARVFGTGYSAGGFFVNQVACRRTGFFRAIAPHAGGAPNEPSDPGATKWPGGHTKCANQTGGVAAIVFHGSDDPTVTVDSGDYTAVYWAAVNGCQGKPRTPVAPPPCAKHEACPTDKPVVYCEVPGIGHGIWSQGAATAWAFFKSL